MRIWGEHFYHWDTHCFSVTSHPNYSLISKCIVSRDRLKSVSKVCDKFWAEGCNIPRYCLLRTIDSPSTCGKGANNKDAKFSSLCVSLFRAITSLDPVGGGAWGCSRKVHLPFSPPYCDHYLSIWTVIVFIVVILSNYAVYGSPSANKHDLLKVISPIVVLKVGWIFFL